MRYIAHFTPEAWVNNYAIEVDPQGPQEWDCTVFALAHLDYLTECGRLNGTSLRDNWGVTDNDDWFKSGPAAPEWVRNWSGPFTIRVREAG